MRIDKGWVVAVMATGMLAACGGGGGDDGDQGPEFQVTVQVDGKSDASNPLIDGESTTIRVASGATLVFNSEVATSWTQAATATVYDVKASSAHSKSLTVSSNGGGALDIVFVDEKEPSRKGTLQVVVAPREFARVPVVDGEVMEMWGEYNLRGVEPISAGTRTTVKIDGTDGPYREALQAFDATTGWISEVYGYDGFDGSDRYYRTDYVDGRKCQYSVPVAYVSYPMYVGKTWSGETESSCAGKVNNKQTYSRVVEAFESVTVPAGTFDALRIKSVLSFTNSSNPRIPGGAFSSVRTCWWAVDIGREVKCEATFTYPAGTEDGVTESWTNVLRSHTR